MTTQRFRTGGGGFGGRGGGGGMTLSFPPFTRAVKWIIGINVGLYLVTSVLGLAPATQGLAGMARAALALNPARFLSGWVWQPLTYSFVQLDLLALIFSSLVMWFLGSLLESSFGTRWLVRYYAICALAAAAATLALAFFVPRGLEAFITGPSGVYLGFMIAFGVLFSEMEFMMFPLPIMIKAKYLAGIAIVIAVLVSLREPAGLLQLGQLGGVAAGLVYIQFFHGSRRAQPYIVPGRGLSDRGYGVAAKTAKQEGLFTRLRNSYYRWKRRRAARKFEVYMRQHNRTVQFDEYGNYIPPDEEKKDNGGEGRGGWVH